MRGEGPRAVQPAAEDAARDATSCHCWEEVNVVGVAHGVAFALSESPGLGSMRCGRWSFWPGIERAFFFFFLFFFSASATECHAVPPSEGEVALPPHTVSRSGLGRRQSHDNWKWHRDILSELLHPGTRRSFARRYRWRTLLPVRWGNSRSIHPFHKILLK